ncbi:hypothetical protein HZH68_009245 [Vespula germanica]|uniref:Uncharacterized protein n=1 Tax=Vespula germanica TaxID=30212 RepID=A0A834N480_VESGE|nr:hypothetical protein HZH68_009245 [Vespula germanica]
MGEGEGWFSDELEARDERIPSYGMRAHQFKGLPACPLFKCMLNARGDVRDSLINPLTSYPHHTASSGVRVFHGGFSKFDEGCSNDFAERPKNDPSSTKEQRR